MIQANIGGDDLPRGTISLRDDMAAYDALHPELRAQLGQMSVNWNAAGVEHIRRGHGVSMAAHVLRKTEDDMQAAYRRRVGL
jgi:hypothetical protein